MILWFHCDVNFINDFTVMYNTQQPAEPFLACIAATRGWDYVTGDGGRGAFASSGHGERQAVRNWGMRKPWNTAQLH